MKKALLYLTLTLAAVVAFVPSVQTQILNAVTPGLLKGGTLTVVAKTPLKIGTNYTLSNPAVAPTGATSATVGSCTTGANSPYRFYTAWANVSGITNLSPASPDVAGTALKRVVVTRSEVVPSGALGWLVYWSGSADAHAAKKLCLAGSADSLLVASGTSTYDCSCSGSGTAHPGSNQTSFKALTTVNSTGNGVIGMGSVGATIGSALENVHTLDMTGTSLKYDGATVGGTALRVVSICATGCQYTTLGAALSAETSTAAAPIEYRIGPGVFVGQTSFSGEDHFAIVGSGPGVTTLQYDTTTALVGAVEPGNSSNYTISNLTIKGKIYQDLNGTAGGNIVWRNLAIESSEVFGDNDCTIIDRPGAGTRLLRENIDCRTITDGNTCHRDCANVDIYDKGNTYTPLFASSSQNASMQFVRFNSTPCYYSELGSALNITAAKTNGSMALVAYAFDGTEATGNCAGTARAYIQGVTSIVRNTSANQGGSSANFVNVTSTADELDELYLIGNTALTSSSDSDDTIVRGVVVDSAATVLKIVGGVYRSTGGLLNTDISIATAGNATVVGVDYQSDDGNVISGNYQRMNVGTIDASSLRLNAAGANFIVGNGAASNANTVTFDAGTTDLAMSWYEDYKFLNLNTAKMILLGGATTDPALNFDNSLGFFAIDTSANQWVYNSGSAERVLDPVRSACYTQRGIAATDDNFIFWMANQAVTVTSVGCFCVGTCSTLPTFTLEDNDGNAMTITGTNPTCGKTTTEASYAAVTAGNALVAGEGIAFDTTNTPVASTDWVTICITYTTDRQ